MITAKLGEVVIPQAIRAWESKGEWIQTIKKCQDHNMYIMIVFLR